MVSPSTTVVASSPEVRAAYVGFVPDISFNDERIAWGTTPEPEAPSNEHATEISTRSPRNVSPAENPKWIFPIEIGTQVTVRSRDVSMFVAPPSVVETGDVRTARPGMIAE